jgi:alpha-1,2-mannosyltransferase
MSVLDSEDSHAQPTAAGSAPVRQRRIPELPIPMSAVGTLAWLSVGTVVVAVGYFIWMSLGVWGKEGLDFSVYWYAGKILDEAGTAPSGLYAGNVDWAGGPALKFTYPPFAAVLFSQLARLPQATALALFNATGAIVAVLAAVRTVRYWNAKGDLRATFRSPGNCWAAAVLVLAVLNLGPWRETLMFGQINVLLMGLMAADLLARNPRWTRGFPGSGFLVGVAAGIKLTPLAFGLYYLVRKDWRGLLNMAAGFTVTVVLGWLLRPVESVQFWFEMLPDTSRLGGAGYVDNLSLKGALLHFGVPEASVSVPWLVLSLMVVALGASVIKAASDQGARVVAVSATALTMLLVSPVSWSHHWVWVAAVFPAFAWTLRETPRRYARMRWTMGGALGISLLVFLFSPKTIGKALGAENLDIQTPGLWIMASSAGVFCAVALLACWLVALRRNSVVPELELASSAAL